MMGESKMAEASSVGWIGLGKLGLPMAARLAASGQGVSGFDRDQARIGLASERGLEAAATLERAVAGRDVIFTSLPDDKTLIAAIVGAGAILSHMKPGAVLCETSTVSPKASAEVAAAAAQVGIDYLRLPISGSSALAETGMVTCIASGPREAFERVRPVLTGFTRAQTWLGEAEQARYAKLAINLMVAVSAGMMAEALALSRKGGIGWADILGVMAESVVASPFVKYKLGPLQARDFSPAFTAMQLVKDLDLILGAVGEAGIPAPLAASLRQSYSAILSAGEGEEDFLTIVRHVERLSGLGEPQ
jgi:3-hydroxyisobutyrate dehydrogenase-like beta-hydroxyacid dehydrogenase